MKTWKLTLEYDGTRYSGWQEQKNARTVMGELRIAAQDFLGAEVDLHGSGRTDAGVHAAAQVAHLRCDLKRPPAPELLARELNERLPADIVVPASRVGVEPFPRAAQCGLAQLCLSNSNAQDGVLQAVRLVGPRSRST